MSVKCCGKAIRQHLLQKSILPHVTHGIQAHGQYRQWVMKWKREITERSPIDHITTMQVCDAAVCPTIRRLLNIAYILLISTATVERTFSTLRLVKTYLRNRMSEV